ncbi:MAG: hypothetical protein U0930_19690 [Pirellulales bacterium]
MSIRTWFSAVSSIEKIRDIVGCKDAKLERALLKELNKDLMDDDGNVNLEEMDDWGRDEQESGEDSIRSLIKGAKIELGSWLYLLEPIAVKRRLFLKLKLPFDNGGWRHTRVWMDYIEHVNQVVSKRSIKLLQHLDYGRPLKGKRLDCDGPIFSWLTNAEIQLLHKSLDQIEVFEDELRVEFHNQLLGTLALCCKKKCDLFMGAG